MEGVDSHDDMPSSPVILALLAILTQLAPSTGYESMCDDSHERLNEVTQYFAQQAITALDNERLSIVGSSQASSYHPHVPLELEASIACCVLSLYQYLCRGDIDQMTLLAHKALELFGRLPHSTETSLIESSPFAEACRRTWWMVYLCLCNASAVSCKPLKAGIDIGTVRIPYPSIDHEKDIWCRYIRAEETLVAATLLLVALVTGINSEAAIPAFNRSLRTLKDLVSHQLAVLSTVPYVEHDETSSAETRLAHCLHILTRVRLMSARIKIHRYRAFMNDLRLLRRFEALASTGATQREQNTENRNSAHSMRRVSRIFPFEEIEARSICLQSALEIANDLKQLSTAGTVAAPSVCSAMIAGYTLMMMSHFQSSSTVANVSSGTTHIKCKTGVATTVEVLDSYAIGSGFLMGLKGRSHMQQFHESIRLTFQIADQLLTAAVACKII